MTDFKIQKAMKMVKSAEDVLEMARQNLATVCKEGFPKGCVVETTPREPDDLGRIGMVYGHRTGDGAGMVDLSTPNGRIDYPAALLTRRPDLDKKEGD